MNRASLTGSLILAVTLLLLAGTLPCHAITPVRVGTMAHADHVELEVHEDTGHLFAVVRYTIPSSSKQLAETYAWVLLISTDGGDSWTQTFSHPRPVRIENLSATA